MHINYTNMMRSVFEIHCEKLINLYYISVLSIDQLHLQIKETLCHLCLPKTTLKYVFTHIALRELLRKLQKLSKRAT